MQTTTDLEAMRELLESMQGQIASLVSQNDALAKQVSDLSEDAPRPPSPTRSSPL